MGIHQLARPTVAGMMAPNTMIRPCRVVIMLKKFGFTNCSPGSNNSARITMAMEPPMSSMMKENQRYRVPISLWLVVNNQRLIPVG